MWRVLCVAMLSLTLPAHAAMSEADAAALRGGLQAWVTLWTGGLLGPDVLPLTVRPDGAQLVMELSVTNATPAPGVTVSPGSFTMRVRPNSDGSWALDDGKLPTLFSVTSTQGVPQTTTFSFGAHSFSGVFDPALANVSRLDAEIADYSMTTTSPAGGQTSHIARISSRNRMTPSGPGRVNMSGDSDITGYAMHTDAAPGAATPAVDVEMQRMRVKGQLDNLDFVAIGAGLRRVLDLAKAPSAPGGRLGKQDRAKLHEAVRALMDVSSALEGQQEMDGISFRMGPQSGTLRHALMGLSMRAVDGDIELAMPIALEGFETPMATDAAIRELLPHGIKLTPRMTGLSRKALRDMLDRIVDSDDTPDMTAEVAALLVDSDVSLALDDVSLDVGPMQIRGKGKIDVAALDDLTGEAELRATGLDALIRRANSVAMLKPAVPVLIFLKGIAEQNGGQAVWKLTYSDGNIEVNGTSLSDLAIPGK
jgi:hypothetical protein